MAALFSLVESIEEGLYVQKARQTVVVFVWEARSYAGIVYNSCCTFLFIFVGGGGMFCVDLYFKFKDRFNKFIYCFICKNATKHLMENQSIYYKICNVQISCHNFDPVRLLSIRLLRSLDRSLWVGGHFPPESNDDSLPWLLYKSFFYGRIPLSSFFLISKTKNVMHSLCRELDNFSTFAASFLFPVLCQRDRAIDFIYYFSKFGNVAPFKIYSYLFFNWVFLQCTIIWGV